MTKAAKDALVCLLSLQDEVYFWNTDGELKTSVILRIFNNNDIRGLKPSLGLRNKSRQINASDVVKIDNIVVHVPEIMKGDIVAFRLLESTSLGEVVSVHGDDLFLKDPINPTGAWSAKSSKDVVVKVEDGKKAMIQYLRNIK